MTKRKRPSPTRRTAPSPVLSSSVLICSFLSLLTWIVFARLRHADFINFDDASYVVDNTHLAAGLTWRGLVWAWTEFGEGYWPITWMSYLVDRQLYGLDGGLFHVTNVLMHTANVCLLFIVLRRMTTAVWPSAWVAAIFAVHPLHVEPVAWIAERNDLLCTLFWLAGLWLYLRYVEDRRGGRYALVMLAYALGLLSKPMIITLPVVLLLLDFWPLNRIRAGALTWTGAFWEKTPLFLMGAAAAVLTFVLRVRVGAVASLDMIPLRGRIGNGLVSYVVYLVKMAWPTNLAVLYPYPLATPTWKAGAAALVLTAIGFLAWRERHRFAFLLFGWLWYVVTLLPVIGIVQTGPQARADRYTYVSMIGVAVAVVWALVEVTRRSAAWRRTLVVAGCVIVAADGLVASGDAGYWLNTETLFRRAIAVTTDNAVAHGVLGSALRDAGRIEEALPEFRESIRLSPDLYLSHSNLGEALMALGRPAEALPELARAVLLQPGLSSTHMNFASALSASGKADEAAMEFREALRISPDNADAHSGLGVVLDSQGHREEAIAEFVAAIRIKPDDWDAHYNLGNVLAELSETDEAAAELSEAVRLRPGFVQAHRTLGVLFAKAGRTQDAIEQFSAAAQLTPDDAFVHSNLGSLLAAAGRLDDAIAEFTKATQLRPDVTEFKLNLDQALSVRPHRGKS